VLSQTPALYLVGDNTNKGEKECSGAECVSDCSGNPPQVSCGDCSGKHDSAALVTELCALRRHALNFTFEVEKQFHRDDLKNMFNPVEHKEGVSLPIRTAEGPGLSHFCRCWYSHQHYTLLVITPTRAKKL
jgi:hypothetical protein